MKTDLQQSENAESTETTNSEKRLWIGNLDPRINEYQLLKLTQIYGKIEKFDLLFYRNGPMAGLPRGYAFVTYAQQTDAVTAREALNNKLVGTKHIVVKWAHSVNNDDADKLKPCLNIPVLAGAKEDEKKPSREMQIKAIEAKLKTMEYTDLTEELAVNKTTRQQTSTSTYKQLQTKSQWRHHNNANHPYRKDNRRYRK